MGFKREDIRDTSPLSLKKLNDTIRFIWLKLFGNIDFADLSQSTQGIINNKVASADFSSLIEQNPDSVKIAVGQIGGNNFVKNSNFVFGMANWAAWGTAPTLEVSSSITEYSKSIRIVTGGNNQGTMQNITNLQVGKKYTISAYCYVVSGQAVLMVDNNNTWDAVTTNSTGKLDRILLTFEAKSSSLNVYIGKSGSGTIGEYYFTAIQLEEGENATAWSPNAGELKSTLVEVTDDHLRATFQDGSYSEMNNQGFKWHKGATTKDYHYLSTAGYVSLPPFVGEGTGLRTAIVQLPDEFKGKTFYVMLSVRSAGTSDGYAKTIYGLGCELLSGSIDYVNATVAISGYAHFNADFNNTPLEISYLVLA